MSYATEDNVFVGNWSYRSWLNDTDLATEPNDLLFGKGTIVIEEGPMEILTGTIGGEGWSLDLHGSRSYGNPGTVRFRGAGVVGSCATRELDRRDRDLGHQIGVVRNGIPG